jgi:hypothetical protein
MAAPRCHLSVFPPIPPLPRRVPDADHDGSAVLVIPPSPYRTKVVIEPGAEGPGIVVDFGADGLFRVRTYALLTG